MDEWKTLIVSGGTFTKDQLTKAGWKYNRTAVGFEIWEKETKELLYLVKEKEVTIIYNK
jgi:hypothetical protein